MGWIELMVLCTIPGNISFSRDFNGKASFEMKPVSFMLIEFILEKAKTFFSAPSKTEVENVTVNQ
jgi:hypothetical protein